MATNLNSIIAAMTNILEKNHPEAKETIANLFSQIGSQGASVAGRVGEQTQIGSQGVNISGGVGEQQPSQIYGRQTPEGMRYENTNVGGEAIGQYSQQGPRAGMPLVQTYTAPPQPEQAPNILADTDLSELRWSDPNQRDLKISITDAQTYGAPIEHQKALLNKYNKIVMGKYGMFQGPDGSWLQKTREGIKPVIEAKEQGIKAYKPGDYLVSGGQMIGQLPPLPKESKEETTPTEMKDYELSIYGKLTPEKRGTPEYIQGRKDWIRQRKEESPYVDALNRQIKVTAKKEGANLRKEFYALPETKTYMDIRQKYEVMGKAFEESKTTKNFVAIDQALITIFNKMTDPESVVRESEYLRTASDLALWNKIKGKMSKVISGGAGLSQEDREALYDMGGKFIGIAEKKYKSRLNEYRSYLNEWELDPDKFIKPYGESVGISGDRPLDKYMR